MIRLSIMGFPDRGEKNLTSSTSSCKNFQPNMFNKTKCQNCFRTREAHAVNPDDGNNKPKKVLLCGFLYVAPGIDFDNPLSRSRKWQRRCFIFYENGELCYALDDDPNTIPQGVVNMYQCTNVFDADQKTGKEFSMGIVTPDETTYIRAETREAKDSWYNALSEYPEINRQEEKLRKKRAKAMGYGQPITNKQEIQADKPRVESTTIAVTAKPPDPIKSSESSQLPKDNQLATQGKVSSTTEKQGLDISTRLGQSLGTTGLRRSQSETTTNRPKRYPEIIDTSAPSRGKDVKESLIVQESSISRRNSAPVKKRDDTSPEKGDAEKNKSSSRNRRYRSDGTQQGDAKRGGRRSRYHTIDVTPTKESPDGNSVEIPVDSQVELPANSQTSVLHRNNNNVNIESSLSSQDTNKRPVDIAPLATQEDLLDVDPEGRARTLSDLSSHSSEDLERMDIPKKSRLGLKVTLEHTDSPSPSKRTIQRRKHAIVRRSRHTLDGSMHMPTPSSDDSESSKDGPTLKRSNSDPSLAESNDMMQRKQIAMTFPGLFHLKKGWLIKQGEAEQDFSKHWFVLCDNKLSYYRDSTDEDDKNKDGEIELSTCQEARETDVSRNYGFQIKMANGIIILAAMTRGIRDNWVQAINKALVTAQEDKAKEHKPSRSVEEVVSRKQASSTESAISDTTDSVERTPSDKRRSSVNREKSGRERRSRRSSKELRDFKRLSVDSVDLPSMKSGDNDSDVVSTSTPVSKAKAPFHVDERELISRNSKQENTAVMELLETEVESLKTQLESTQRDRVRVQQENAELRALMNAVQREHKDNFEDLENEHTAYITQIEQLAEKQDELSDKNAKYELQTQRLQMELKQAKNKAGLFEQQNEELEERLLTTATNLEDTERECNDLKNRLHTAKATTKDESDFEQASSIIEQLNDRIGLLEQELNNSRTRCSDLEDDVIAKSREINTLHQREKNNESKQTAETEIVHMLRMQLQEAHERLQESEQDCISNEERFGKRYNRLETKFEAEKAALEERLEEAEASIKSLTSQPKEERVSPSRGNFDSVVPLSPLPPDASMEEIGLKLAEREQQLMDLRRQLKKEVTSKSVLQEKYDDLVSKPTQMNVEDTVDSSVLRGLEAELESARQENKRLASELDKERAGGKSIHEKLAAESLAKSELADKFKSLYKLAQKQQEELKVARAAQTPEGAHKVLTERNAIIMKLQEELRKQIAEKQNLNKNVHTLSGDLASFQAQLAGKDQDVSKLKEQLQESESQNGRMKQVLQTNVSQITTLKQQLGGLEGMRDELRQLQAQIEKEKGEYTIELQNKEDQLRVGTEKLATVQAELKSLETKLREAEQASTRTENDFEKRVLALETETEDVQKKFDRSEKEVKRLRNELKVSQGAYDELDLKALQAREDIKRLERTNAEQTELMGQRIQDLTNKLATSERKVRDLQNMEQKTRFVHGGSSRGSPVQAALIETKLKEVESKLGDVENTMETQDIESNNLQGKINSVEQQVEAREAEPTSAEQTSSEDRSSPLVIRDSSSSVHQETTSGPDDTDSSSSQDMVDTNPAQQAKVLESKLTETENKLKEVTRKLVDVTTKQLEDRKTNQTRRASENKLKEQVKELEKKVEELNYSLEKVRSNGELVEQEKSHREKLSELRDSFHEQLKLIQEEKDKQLNEEAQATAKVIASLQEKHEQEIEQERLNLQGGINSDVEAVMKRHREVVNQMNKEWQILSQKFSQVCQENTQLSRQVGNLTKALGEAQTQTEQLLTHNKELGNRLKEEVVALSNKISEQGEEDDTEEVLQVDRNDNEQITPTKVALHIRDVELQCANEELKMVQGKLSHAVEKQKLSNKLRLDLESKCQSHQDYIEALKGEVDDLQRQVQRVRTSGEGAAAQDEPEPEVV